MNFKSYTEIENIYNEKFLAKVRELHYGDPEHLYMCFSKTDGCLAGNTYLDTLEFGKKTIKDIVENNLNCHVKCYDHQTNEIVFCSILNRSKTKSKNNWFKIITDDGKELFITGNHKVYLPKLNCYRCVDELTENDEFLIVKN